MGKAGRGVHVWGMRPNQDVRWKQRFQNFDRAFGLRRRALGRGPGVLSPLEKEGVIQRFEYSFALAGRTVKDFLEAGGLTISPVGPRPVRKDAFAAKRLVDGQVWIDRLDHRNWLAHTDDSAVFEKAVDAIAARDVPAMADLRGYWANQAAA